MKATSNSESTITGQTLMHWWIFFSVWYDEIWMADQSNQSKKEGKDQESIQSSTTPDLGHHIGK